MTDIAHTRLAAPPARSRDPAHPTPGVHRVMGYGGAAAAASSAVLGSPAIAPMRRLHAVLMDRGATSEKGSVPLVHVNTRWVPPASSNAANHAARLIDTVPTMGVTPDKPEANCCQAAAGGCRGEGRGKVRERCEACSGKGEEVGRGRSHIVYCYMQGCIQVPRKHQRCAASDGRKANRPICEGEERRRPVATAVYRAICICRG